MKPRKNRVRFACILAACSVASNINILAQAVSDDKSASTMPVENDKEGVVTLTPFSVTASQDTGYGAMQASSGRLGELYIDTPQATSIVTGELMKDAHLVSSFTALKFVANAAQTDSGHSPAFNIRGLRTGEIYLDGFSIGGGTTIDSAFFDRIEVVKGPATAGYGRGNPAGFLNFVSKTPTFTNSTAIETLYGTGGEVDNLRTVLDNNGFVTRDGKTAYRMVASYSRGSSTKEGSSFERSGLLLAVNRQIQRGQLIATINIFNNNNPSVIGSDLSNAETYEKYLYNFYPPGSLPSHTLFPDADESRLPAGIGLTDKGIVSSLILNYNLTKNWSTRQALNLVDKERKGTWSGPAAELYDPATQMGRAFVFNQYNDTRVLTYQSDFAGRYASQILKSTYTLLLGADYTDTRTHGSSQVANSTAAPLFPWNPALATYSFPLDLAKRGTVTSGNRESIYAQLSATFLDGKIRATVAQRKNYFDLQGQNFETKAITSNNKSSTPVFGTYSLMYKPKTWLSMYVTSAKYQDPARTQNLYNGLPASDPRSNELILVQPVTDLLEFGVKGTLFNDKVTFTIARYRNEASGTVGFQILPEVIIDGVIVHASVGFKNTNVNEGWEFEAFGKLTNNLTFLVGGGIQEGTVTIPDFYNPQVLTLGQDPGNSLFGRLKYSFGDSPAVGLSLSGGAKVYFSGWSYWTGSSQYYTGEQKYSRTDTVVDIGLSYGFSSGRYRVGLDVTNVFHGDASVHTFGGQNTESGRLVFLTFDAKF